MANQGPKLPRRTVPLALLATAGVCLSLAIACRKEAVAPAPVAPATPAAVTPPIDVEAITGRVGVKPGAITYPGVGPAASVMTSRGTLTVRRAGDDRVVEVTPKMALSAGDQIRTGPHTEATVALADNTLIQLAEETALAIGNRGVASDPASSAAILYGVARVSISPRTRGEGAFLTNAAGAIIGAKGTVFVVAVTADGRVRVGVEHGEVEVAGPAALDKPVTLATAEVVVVDAEGGVGQPEPFKRDDWGTWRYAAEADVPLEAIVRMHADRLVRAESRLDADYAALQALATTASTLTWQAEANAKPKGLGDYKATAAERATAIEATYRLATEIARVTSGALADAFALAELYVRHPKEVEPQILEFGQEVAGAALYAKKLQLVSEIYLTPMRQAYYAHTARGRARAASIGLPLPPSAQGRLAEVSAAELAKKLARPLYVPPRPESTTHPHPLWQRGPALGWDARLTLQPVPPRQGSWYIAPVRVDARLLVGVKPQVALPPSFPPTQPLDAAKSELAFLVPPLPPMGPADGGAP